MGPATDKHQAPTHRLKLKSGFIPGDSTVNQLVDIYNTCTFCIALDKGKEIHVILCDIRKAFDRV